MRNHSKVLSIPAENRSFRAAVATVAAGFSVFALAGAMLAPTGQTAPAMLLSESDGSVLTVNSVDDNGRKIITTPPIDAIEVTVVDANGDVVKTKRINDPNASSTTIPGLDPNGSYTFEVAKINSAGKSAKASTKIQYKQTGTQDKLTAVDVVFKEEAAIEAVAVEVDDLNSPIMQEVSNGQYEQKVVIDETKPIYGTENRIVETNHVHAWDHSRGHPYGCGHKGRATCFRTHWHYDNHLHYEAQPTPVIVGYETKMVDDLTKPIVTQVATGSYAKKILYKLCTGVGINRTCTEPLDASKKNANITLDTMTVRTEAIEVDDLTRPIMAAVSTGKFKKKAVDDTTRPIYRNEQVWESSNHVHAIDHSRGHPYGCGHKGRATCFRTHWHYEDHTHWDKVNKKTVVGYHKKMVDDLTQPMTRLEATGEYYKKTQYRLCYRPFTSPGVRGAESCQIQDQATTKTLKWQDTKKRREQRMVATPVFEHVAEKVIRAQPGYVVFKKSGLTKSRRSSTGEVAAVGSGVTNVSVGDTKSFLRYSGKEFTFNGQTYVKVHKWALRG